MSDMDNAEFDQALVASAFRLAAERGWDGVSVAQAARDADLPLDRARRRFPGALHGADALRQPGRPGRAGAGDQRRRRTATGCSTC